MYLHNKAHAFSLTAAGDWRWEWTDDPGRWRSRTLLSYKDRGKCKQCTSLTWTDSPVHAVPADCWIAELCKAQALLDISCFRCAWTAERDAWASARKGRLLTTGNNCPAAEKGVRGQDLIAISLIRPRWSEGQHMFTYPCQNPEEAKNKILPLAIFPSHSNVLSLQ